uniref:Uncharacterized protein n=1 Tax=Strix occidentalis caurina TaxID=311401 RepID=A0A8D0ELJ6_STROC
MPSIHKKPIVKLPEAEGSDKSFWHLMTAGKKYAANSCSTTGFWRDMNEGPQGRNMIFKCNFILVGGREFLEHVLLFFPFSGKIV